MEEPNPPYPTLMKGVASLDTGQDFRVGDSSYGSSSSTPIVSPDGWHLADGFTEPGIKATIPKPARRWLRKLRRFDMDARTEKVVEAMKDDDTIDEILAMLDVRSPQCSSFVPNAPTVNAFLLEPKSPSRFTIRFKSQINDNGSEAHRRQMELFLETC